MLGDAQIVVLIVLLQRILENLYAIYNTRRLLAKGAREAGRDYYPVVVITHLAWLAAIFLIVPPEREIIWLLMGLYILLQGARYWVIGTLGRYWTMRIIVPQKAKLIGSGPFRYLRHPNYTVVMLETFLLPLVFGAWAISVVMTAVIGAVLYYKIVLEEKTLERRRAA